MGGWKVAALAVAALGSVVAIVIALFFRTEAQAALREIAKAGKTVWWAIAAGISGVRGWTYGIRWRLRYLRGNRLAHSAVFIGLAGSLWFAIHVVAIALVELQKMYSKDPGSLGDGILAWLAAVPGPSLWVKVTLALIAVALVVHHIVEVGHIRRERHIPSGIKRLVQRALGRPVKSGSSLTSATLEEDVLRICCEVLQYGRKKAQVSACIFVPNGSGQLVSGLSCNMDSKTITLDVEASAAGTAFSAGGTLVYVPSTKRRSTVDLRRRICINLSYRRAEDERGSASVLCIPIFDGGPQPTRVLSCMVPGADAFTPTDADMAMAVATVLSKDPLDRYVL